MRISSGIYRGRTLMLPPRGTRATKDMVKQAVFNILSTRIVDATVLDLFAGSGLIGVEALSRGAKRVIFNDRFSSSTIKKNLAALNIEAEVLSLNYDQALKRLAAEHLQFDFIYLDPPYAFKQYQGLVELIFKLDLLALNGQVMVEVERHSRVNFTFLGQKTYNYGDTQLICLSPEEQK